MYNRVELQVTAHLVLVSSSTLEHSGSFIEEIAIRAAWAVLVHTKMKVTQLDNRPMQLRPAH